MQADLNLRCAHISEGTFSDVVVQLVNCQVSSILKKIQMLIEYIAAKVTMYWHYIC